MSQSATSLYQQELEQLQAEHKVVAERCRYGSMARGATFLASASLFFYAYFQANEGTAFHWGAFAASVFIFLVVVIIHHIFEKREKFLQTRIDFYGQGLARMKRDWEKLDTAQKWFQDGTSEKAQDIFQATGQAKRSDSSLLAPLINDLDLEGEKSLWRLMGFCQTEMGKEFLNRWMLEDEKAKRIQDRQDAVKALADQNDWRHPFLLLIREMAEVKSDPASVVRWSLQNERPAWMTPLIWVARVSTLTVAVLLVLAFLGLIQGNTFGLSVSAIFLVHFLISVCTAGYAGETFRKIGSNAREVGSYRRLMEMIVRCPVDKPFVKERKAELSGGNSENPVFLSGMRSLVNISMFSSIRRGVAFPLYVILQFGILWDVHLMDFLWRWKSKWGSSVPVWFSACGQMEAISCVSQFSFEHVANENGDWVFPNVASNVSSNESSSESAKPSITGQQMGHPLLGDQAVCNPISIGPSDQTVLVTGSNMSGKSTYLRALGVNLILGRMGAPVFAKEFFMPPVSIGTSMRVSDSLSDGISFFMSELKRLKQIVDAAKNYSKDIQFVYLLDEILQGTNSQERQIAVTKVVTQLQKASAIGALSTHDLQLPDVKELAGHLNVVHFKESFIEEGGQKKMTFDYRLRDGLSPSTNALKLLALVGLDE